MTATFERDKDGKPRSPSAPVVCWNCEFEAPCANLYTRVWWGARTCGRGIPRETTRGRRSRRAGRNIEFGKRELGS